MGRNHRAGAGGASSLPLLPHLGIQTSLGALQGVQDLHDLLLDDLGGVASVGDQIPEGEGESVSNTEPMATQIEMSGPD